TTYVPTH
ncbi:hypothetical protein VCHENC02_5115B, partial [Vibrio harveyi]